MKRTPDKIIKKSDLTYTKLTDERSIKIDKMSCRDISMEFNYYDAQKQEYIYEIAVPIVIEKKNGVRSD